MAHEDPGIWTTIGVAAGGILTGLAGVFGFRRRSRNAAGDKMRAEIRALQDEVRDVKHDLAYMKAAREEDAATLKHFEERHDQLIGKVFDKLETIGLSVNTLQTEVRLVLRGEK